MINPMNKKRSEHSGENEFKDFYSKQYPGRWDKLYTNLLKKPVKVARINGFAGKKSISESVRNFKKFNLIPGCYIADSYPKIIPSSPDGLKTYYLMDPASIIPVLQLDIKKGDRILDMCAAPGGKSLILAEKIKENCTLTLNDISKKRVFKLRKILQDYLPPEIYTQIKISNLNGSDITFRREPGFEKILLDAPCSAERHLLAGSSSISEWKISRTKANARKQFSLLSSALLALMPGGILVYSTCSLSSFENDEIIKKLVKRHENQIKIIHSDSTIGEKTEYGQLILPAELSCGPIYYSVIKKLS